MNHQVYTNSAHYILKSVAFPETNRKVLENYLKELENDIYDKFEGIDFSYLPDFSQRVHESVHRKPMLN